MDIKGQLAIQRMYDAGAFHAETPALSRTEIARMNRADLAETLRAHGLGDDELKGAKVADLRALLAKTVFVEL